MSKYTTDQWAASETQLRNLILVSLPDALCQGCKHLRDINVPITAVHIVSNGSISNPTADFLPGRFCLGRKDDTMVSPPFRRPEAPSPATALATMNIFDVLASAQRSDPISKTKKKTR